MYVCLGRSLERELGKCVCMHGPRGEWLRDSHVPYTRGHWGEDADRQRYVSGPDSARCAHMCMEHERPEGGRGGLQDSPVSLGWGGALRSLGLISSSLPWPCCLGPVPWPGGLGGPEDPGSEEA